MLEELEKILKASGKLPFLFIGSGLSRRYLKLPNWEELLKNFAKIQSYNFYKTSSNSHYPLIGSHIAEDYHKYWFENNKDTEMDFSFKTDPFKYEIAKYLNKKLDYKLLTEKEQKEIEALKLSKISGIITTNYDTLIEDLFEDKSFHKFVGQDNLLFNRTYDYGEIYKIHGCVEDYKSIVITKEDYAIFEDKQQYLISKLLSIFLEYPIIFLGYSFSDENIEKIFINILKTIGKENVKKLQNRIIFIEWVEDKKLVSFNRTFKVLDNINLPITNIKVNSFIEVFNILNDLTEKYSPKLVRHLKNKIFELVQTEKTTNKVLVKEKDLSKLNNNLTDLEIVIGFSVIGEIGSKGLISYTIEDVINDILEIKLITNADGLIEKTFTKMQGNLPVFKYLKNKNINQDNYKTYKLHYIVDNIFCTIIFYKLKNIIYFISI